MDVDAKLLSAVHRMLRGRQNIVTSTLLRQHGYMYKVAFGCSLPDVKDVARQIGEGLTDETSPFFGLDATSLAEALWNDVAVRESRMLAPLLYPRGTMTVEVAERWALAITTPEVADVVCMYAFQYGIGHQLIDRWKDSDNAMLRYCARSLAARIADN